MNIGLERLPDIKDLELAYNTILGIEKTYSKLDLRELSLYAQWTRFDSRLGEICATFLSRHWKEINPIELHDIFELQPWPSVLGVLLEFCPDESPLFCHWKKAATCGFSKANWEQYFIGKRRIAGSAMFEDVCFSLEQYRRWGYLAREILINKAYASGSNSQRLYSREVRFRILSHLLENKNRITTQDYWEAIGRCVSKRQAERDLSSYGSLKSIGNTKGKYFLKSRIKS